MTENTIVFAKKVKKLYNVLQRVYTEVGNDMDIISRIEDTYPKLTRKQKQIADYILQNTDTLTFITLKELSTQVGVTEITILNLCKQLGYGSFNEVKYECRKLLGNNERQQLYEGNEYYQIDIPDYELSDEEKFLNDIRQEELQLVVDTIKGIDMKHLLKVAERIVSAQKVMVCGRGVSYLLCEQLSIGLPSGENASMKINTELNESVFAAVPAMDKNTVLIAFSFPDYYFATDKVAEYAKDGGAKVIAITDTDKANICQYADEVVLAKSSARLVLNTLSAPMAVVNLLVSAIRFVVKNRKNKTKREKIEKFSV